VASELTAEAAEAAETVVAVAGLDVSYGRRQVLFDVGVEAARGEIVAVLGHNGAGKTTLLHAIAGLVPRSDGSIQLGGEPLARNPRTIPGAVALVPAERCVFRPLSVRDNLRLGASERETQTPYADKLAEVVELFPVLGERLDQKAGTMSGGQQRMLGVAIALMREPDLLLLDEPSLGLAPAVAESIFAAVTELCRTRGLAVLVVEQSVHLALRVSDRAYVIRNGHVIVAATSEQLREREQLWELF
jgi:branched-chain amino acid transport system ATP-binding protein